MDDGSGGSVLTRELVRRVTTQSALSLWGIHGISHWARLRETGLRLAAETGANPRVVELFALFHDACRRSDGRDPEHGRRGAALAGDLGRLLPLSEGELSLLQYACTHHTDGLTQGDITIQTCWDADRLDLGRVGIVPDPLRLCTEAARESAMLRWAHRRACDRLLPDFVATHWGLAPE